MSSQILPHNQMKVINIGHWWNPFEKFKYQLGREHTVQTEVYGYDIDLPLIRLKPDGLFTLKIWYRWNGASGPTWDTPSCHRGSAFHDGFYHLMKLGLLPVRLKTYADERLRADCIEDGMLEFRANYWFWGVQTFGASSCNPPSQLVVAEPFQDADHG